MHTRKLLLSALVTVACAFQACGPEDSQGPGTDTGTGESGGKDTLTAGGSSGGGTTGLVPGIDCEGICGPVVAKPPAGTVVVQQCFRGAIPGNDTAPLVKVKHSLTQTADGEVSWAPRKISPPWAWTAGTVP